MKDTASATINWAARSKALDEFLALYPDHGPDAGTGPRSRARCECGHESWKHHQLGACIAVIESKIGRDGESNRIRRTYCPCLDYRQVQPK